MGAETSFQAGSRKVAASRFDFPKLLEEHEMVVSVFDGLENDIQLLSKKADMLHTEKKALTQQSLTGKQQVKINGYATQGDIV